MKKIPVIAVVGPTASGKTSFAVKLAKALGGEIVSADSMQIYRSMDIATAKPTAEEMDGISHHLIGYVDPEETYSVKRFVDDAAAAIEEIAERRHVPIVCGGTGLYVDALLGPMAFEEEPDDPTVRTALRQELSEKGLASLVARLRGIDPECADEIDLHNDKRVLRALEIYLLTGEKPSVRRKRACAGECRFDPLVFTLCFCDRAILYQRIDDRVSAMMASGLLAEAKLFWSSHPSETAAAAIGYKELKPYIDGGVSLEEALENLCHATRRYAKRQIAWFKRNENAIPIYCDRDSEETRLQTAIRAAREKYGEGFGEGVTHEG